MSRKLLLPVLVIAALAAAWYFARPIRIDGYTGFTSYDRSEPVDVYLTANRVIPERWVRLHDVRGRAVDSVRTEIRRQQIRSEYPWRDGFGFERTFSYDASHLESGVYLWENRVPFVLRNDTARADLAVVYPANTIAAYNRAGGRSLYGPTRWYRVKYALSRFFTLQWRDLAPPPFELRGTAVSFRRTGQLEHWEYFRPFLEWISDADSLRINYISDPDLDDFERIGNAEMLAVIGHSEYWSRAGRMHFDRFVAEGRPAAVLSGNTMWWQVRYSDDRSAVICYKDAERDPEADFRFKTLNWIDERLAYPVWPSIGAQFDLGGYGLTGERGRRGYRIIRPQSPLLEGVTLPADSILSIPTLEYDGTLIAGFDRFGHPVPDTAAMGFHRFELIGYDFGTRGGAETVGTFVVLQRTPVAGTIVNTASTDWAGERGFSGRDSTAVRRITSNILSRLLTGESAFSADP